MPETPIRFFNRMRGREFTINDVVANCGIEHMQARRELAKFHDLGRIAIKTRGADSSVACTIWRGVEFGDGPR
jgi:hypothetical protein